MGTIIAAVILISIAIGCYLISCLQFLEKGFLFNNAYLYASGKERESMNKTPYYRQSGFVFLLIGTIFALNGASVVLEADWLTFAAIAMTAATILYAILSSIAIERQKNRNS